MQLRIKTKLVRVCMVCTEHEPRRHQPCSKQTALSVHHSVDIENKDKTKNAL